jgi:TnpA family transposase
LGTHTLPARVALLPASVDSEHPWSLTPGELEWLPSRRGHTRLGIAVFLKHFQAEGRFPERPEGISPEVIAEIARQAGVDEAEWPRYDWGGRAWKLHRRQIREALGFRPATVEDADRLAEWLRDSVVGAERDLDHLTVRLRERCRMLSLEPPSTERTERIVRSSVNQYEQDLYARIHGRLAAEAQLGLDALLHAPRNEEEQGETISDSASWAVLNRLRADAGRPSVRSVQDELAKLTLIRSLELPADLFHGVSSAEIDLYRQRVAVEAPYELRRHAEAVRLTWLAAYAYLRGRQITDTLVDLLIDTIHGIGARAERKVEREMLEDLRRVTGKQNLLFRIADAALQNPDALVRDAVFPVVSESVLRALVKEWKATGPTYRTTLRTVIRSSYQSHYRRMVPALLEALTFRSNNEAHRPLIEALDLLKRHRTSRIHNYPLDEEVPIEGVVRGLWKEAVLSEHGDGAVRVNRITYEICALEALREKLRCKEIWVEGADRYRNPEEDLPQDFEEQREAYYAALELPSEANRFIDSLRQEMIDVLDTLERSISRNPHVRIKTSGQIVVSPLPGQTEAQNLARLKAEIAGEYPMTSLLDMLKEADLRLGFSDAFRTSTLYESMDRRALQSRLLLCLHGMGTNTGLRRMNAAHSGISYKDLLYTRKRYINADRLREAIRTVVNGTLHARRAKVWGDGTTACASDSKHFGAWDQNLMTKWHVRYGGPGIMVYWHVEKKSLCIYSQLKTTWSSEAASMIEGVLRHCTDADIERQYVDSHGQSEVAFAFCRLLGFELLPRLKAVQSQRLYRPAACMGEAWPRLVPVLTRPIDWALIRQQYDQLVKYTTALRLGTAKADAILRRFTRSNVQHPTYKALSELGKAVKTIFLCRYLQSEALRREIHEGLNVIEQWNGANDFIFFGRKGDFTSNRKDDQEESMLALHLLQNCLVYVNTLMVQRVLARPHWEGELTEEDLRALTPLIWEHVNPYGTYQLDMDTRLVLD